MSGFEAQERALRAVLSALEFSSVLELGARGRIEQLVLELRPDVAYRGVEREETGRPLGAGADLVIAVDYLMHLEPAEAETATRKMLRAAGLYLVTCDWTVPLPRRVIVPGNHLHDYGQLLGQTSLPASNWSAPRAVESAPAGPLQAVHLVRRP